MADSQPNSSGDAPQVRQMRWGDRRAYLPEEDQFIQDNYTKLTPAEIASRLNRTMPSIYKRKRQLGCLHQQLFAIKKERRKCKQCGKKFTVVPSSNRKYCGLKCAYASKDRIMERPIDRGTRICPRCGREWKVTTRTAGRRHCSHRCSLLAMAKTREHLQERRCTNCGKAFTVKAASLRRCCSQRCSSQRKSKNGKAIWRNDSFRKKMSDVIATRHAMKPAGSPLYSNRKSGRRSDLGNVFFRSAWEANYARYLNLLKSRGEIVSWRFEPRLFVFADTTEGVRSYRPDFEVTDAAGDVAYHEVKGYDHPRGKIARRKMSAEYPGVRLVLINESRYREVAKLRHEIDGWEK